jgi:Tfp pilus assembly protein PilF
MMLAGRYTIVADLLDALVEYRVRNEEIFSLQKRCRVKSAEQKTHADEAIESAYQRVEAMLSAGKTEDAVKILNDVLLLSPDNCRVHNDLGVLYTRVGNHEKALYHYETAVNGCPDGVVFLKTLPIFITR